MREALTTWAVQEALTEEVMWSWGLKEEQEFASQEGKGCPRWEGSRGKGPEEREQGGPCSSHPRVLLRTPDESALPRGLPSLMGETCWSPAGYSL